MKRNGLLVAPIPGAFWAGNGVAQTNKSILVGAWRSTLLIVALVFGAVATLSTLSLSAHAQSVTSGDIVGVVTDSSGAAIPNAKIVVTSNDTGIKQVLTSNGNGSYRAPLLQPGAYDVVISAVGFETASTRVTVAVGQTTSGDTRLKVGSNSVTVEVSTEAGLLHTENADLSTSISQEQVANLPNPGNDLTFVAQVSPGAVMNNAGGNGNFSVFGLPAVSNTFTRSSTATLANPS